jgi:hypothetical protein
MAEYHLLTVWRIEAPLEKVYAAIENSLCWPEWWPSVRKVEQTADGDEKGINSVRRYSWQGKLPYRVVFDVRATRIDKLVAIEGTAQGDLEGIGCWKFSRQGSISIVQYEWHVRSHRWWMNLIAPVARSIFIRNHEQIMSQGGKALAHLLSAPLAGQESTDLMAIPVAPRSVTRRVARGRLREHGRIDPSLVLVVGLVAGLIAMVARLDVSGFTVLFSWFVAARDWVTLVAHIVFGIALLGGCRLLLHDDAIAPAR